MGEVCLQSPTLVVFLWSETSRPCREGPLEVLLRPDTLQFMEKLSMIGVAKYKKSTYCPLEDPMPLLAGLQFRTKVLLQPQVSLWLFVENIFFLNFGLSSGGASNSTITPDTATKKLFLNAELRFWGRQQPSV